MLGIVLVVMTTSEEKPANLVHCNILKHAVCAGTTDRASHTDDKVTWQQRPFCRESSPEAESTRDSLQHLPLPREFQSVLAKEDSSFWNFPQERSPGQ